MPETITRFRADIPEAALADLRRRLTETRWPEAETVDDWSQGVPLAYLRELCQYWADEHDWRAAEARLNSFPQYRTEIDGLGIHFLHVRSPHPDALPLLLTHGWPGSVLEFLKVIGPLTNPADPRDAFHVVCPSLPGYGFSDKPRASGWGVHRIATAWIELMDRLGYERFGAHGGDWGTSVTTSIAQQVPRRIVGIHLAPPLAAPDPDTFGELTDAERAAIADLDRAKKTEDGYSVQQGTRPQTLGYALTDSPAGQCAWILEKFRAWTDCDGDPERALTRDEMLDNITLYWLTGTAASSARLYWESITEIQKLFTDPTTSTVDVPVGAAIFPKELLRPSRRWAAKRFTDIRQWSELPRGGHFGAFEQPELFVDDLRAFFRLVR
ncbi:epoxide hydrolase family protein [Allokutzneria albata]|uniref:Pimeloyl-ACP methyl ester carboxylesterase n=1 Tax=Allokutzneria albata TaxID=211114 RepID=A0A1G9T8H5_ALLAB|nr:epoxide hydrolase family protein [Allokutzneria albata]SDM43981.1 Pimeloyl-ACP methyl ester carboxylesterase [Allokutzneria albata]